MSSDNEYLLNHRQIWQQKPILRRIYQEQFYSPILENLAPGLCSLEIGSGPGFLRDIKPSIWRTDILYCPWNHVLMDAHAIPFGSSTLDNVIGLDVLHHFNRPIGVLREITRVLRPGGRLILVEPWITPLSRFVYAHLHQEACEFDIEPWQDDDQFGQEKNAFDGNAAIPYLLLTKGQTKLAQALPNLELTSIRPFSLLTYLLSLGFKPGSLLPSFAYNTLYAIEDKTRSLWVRWAALRAVIIWERRKAGEPGSAQCTARHAH